MLTNFPILQAVKEEDDVTDESVAEVDVKPHKSSSQERRMMFHRAHKLSSATKKHSK